MPETIKSDEYLWPNEEYAIEQFESGKDKPKFFKTVEEPV